MGSAAREGDDRQGGGEIPDLPYRLQPVPVRHEGVTGDEIETVRAEPLKPFAPGADRRDLMTLGPQDQLDSAAQQKIIIDDEYASHSGLPLGTSRATVGADDGATFPQISTSSGKIASSYKKCIAIESTG